MIIFCLLSLVNQKFESFFDCQTTCKALYKLCCFPVCTFNLGKLIIEWVNDKHILMCWVLSPVTYTCNVSTFCKNSGQNTGIIQSSSLYLHVSFCLSICPSLPSSLALLPSCTQTFSVTLFQITQPLPETEQRRWYPGNSRDKASRLAQH